MLIFINSVPPVADIPSAVTLYRNERKPTSASHGNRITNHLKTNTYITPPAPCQRTWEHCDETRRRTALRES